MRHLWIAIAVVIGLVWSADRAAAQRGPVYCNVTEIKSEQLSNGVRVTIVTDGQVEWDFDWERMMAEGDLELRRRPWGMDWGWSRKLRRLSLRLWNARSKLGSGFVDVSKYPVSHVEIAVPSWAHEGVGLEVAVVNYLGWGIGEGELFRRRYRFDIQTNESGNGIVITWRSDRFPPPPPPETPKDLPAELEVWSDSGKLSVRAVNARVEDVADAISREAGVPVVCAIEGDLRVTARLDEMEPEAALGAIGLGLGLCVGTTPKGDCVLAEGLRNAAGYGAASARTIPLHHLPAMAAIDLLPNFLLGYLRADAESNTVIATGPAWMLDRVASDLSRLDRPPPQVSLEVTVVEYKSGEVLESALQAAGLLGTAAVGIDAIAGEVQFLQLGDLPRGWEAALAAREAAAETELRAKTTIKARNGAWARVFVGQQRNIIIEVLGGGGEMDILPVDIGTSLEMQSLMGGGDEVLLYLRSETKTHTGTDPASGLPVVALREAEGVARVRHGETVLVAGLSMEQASRERRGIPLLRDLPLIGRLFDARSRSRSSTHLAVFVTPHVDRDPLASEGGRRTSAAREEESHYG